jgi:hypothetical protein
MAAQASKTRTGNCWPERSFWGRQTGEVCPLVHADQIFGDNAGNQRLFQSGPGVPPEFNRQPPAAPAATEAASVHLARWAPHPLADTASGTEPSPRMPALVTMPPRQKLVDEATSVKAATPAADPSSLPVAELVCRRAAAPWRKTGLIGRDFSFTRVEMGNGQGEIMPARYTRSLLWGRLKPFSGDLLQREEGFAKLADGGGYLPCSQPVVGD